MATLVNVGNDSNILVDLGSPTLGGTDIINIVKGDVDYDDNLGVLSTAVAQINVGPGYSGMLGNYPDGLLAQAGIIRLGHSGRKTALKGDNSGTVALLEWKNLVAGDLSLSLYAAITLAVLAGPGNVKILGTAIVATAQLTAGGLTVYFEDAGTAITTLLVAPDRGTATAITDRDVGTVSVKAGGVVEAREACSPATVNVDKGTYRHASSGAVGAINAGGGAVIDFSKAAGDSATITWALTGDITIIEPPAGISVDMPTSVEQGSHRITYKPAA